MSNRLSQLPVEVLILPDAPITLSVSQVPVEVLILPDTPITLRLSQLPVEVLRSDTAEITRAHLSQLPVEVLLSAPAIPLASALRASHLVADVLMDADQPPGLLASHIVVDALVTDTALLFLRLSHLVADVLVTEPPSQDEAYFDPDEAPIGLTWIEFIDSDGELHVWSNLTLPDPASYFGGFKEHRVIEFNSIRRGLSNIDGAYEGIVWGWTLSG